MIAGPVSARADDTCSAPGQPPCSCGFLCFDCDFSHLVLLGECSDADGFPASCGGLGERPCTIFEHIPSCKTGLSEIPFPGGNCIQLDADGFPSFCGGTNERACTIFEHIPSCKSGLIEERGTCRAFDADGYPTSCGGTGEPPCTLDVQIIAGIRSCKPCNVEVPLGVACRAIGEDRYPSTCGHCDQPACDLTVQAQTFMPPCQPGLTDQAGTCKRLSESGSPLGCAGLGEPGLDTTVPPPAASPGQPAWGFADLHAHPFANLAFGGLVTWGAPFSAGGIDSALPKCDFACGFEAVDPNGNRIAPAAFPLPPGVAVHGPFGQFDLFGKAGFGDLLHGHDVHGHPSFGGWPRHNEISHQQMYYRWIERAYRGGLRLMVALAVNNEVLCRLSNRKDNFACEDMPTVDRQIAALESLQGFIDQEHGGTGMGWFRIVRSAAEARQALDAGKMAVVIGIEVDSLFGCGLNSTCTEEDVRRELGKFHEVGVRHVFPIHLFDNAFGGAAVYQDFFNIGNLILSGQYLDVEDCSTEGIEYRLLGLPGDPFSLFARQIIESVLGVTLPVPSYPPGGHCNTRGLTPLGESLLRLMMSRRMIVDIDHMSARATDRALELAVEHDYPVVSGHSGFLEVARDRDGTVDEKRAESAKKRRHVETIRDLGGIVAPILHQGHAQELNPFGPAPNDCSNSSKTWAQAYMYAADLMQGGPYHQAVALGSDFNGGISPVGPRFGPNACERDSHPAQGAGVSYPFAAHGMPGSFGISRTGELAFDYNTLGLAHVGLLPDFVEDLKRVGLSDADLDPLFRSAEAYVAMWERIDSRSVFPPSTTFTATPPANANGWHNGNVNVGLAATPHPDGWQVKGIRYEASGAQVIPSTVAPGTTAQALVTEEGTTTFSFGAEDVVGSLEPAQSASVSIDRAPPTASAAATPAPNAAGWNNTDVTVVFTGADDTSGIGACDAITISVEGTGLSETGGCADLAGNVSAPAAVTGINVDKTSPTVTATPDRPADSGGWYNHALTVAWTGVDSLSGLASCSAGDVYAGPDTPSTSVAGACGDRAGNSGSASFTFRFDATAPVVNIATPASGTEYLLNAVVEASYVCTDALSGVASCNGPVGSGSPLDTATAGARQFSVSAADVAGNGAAASHPYAVRYGFSGFLSPLAPAPVVNNAKAGRTIPVKYRLSDANGTLLSDLGTFVTLQSAPYPCDAGAPSIIVGETAETAGSTVLRYDAASQQFVYNWQTSSAWAGTCRALQLGLADGTNHVAVFEFR
jgi:microsomal dipeptidase-like Zn-dependent dipeptidase